MKIKFLCLTILFFISMVSAQNLECSLNVHTFNQGREVLIYNENSSFDGLSFEVIGINKIDNSRILNISILNSTPIQFESSLPDIPSDLRILQTKTLWISKIIDTKQFSDGQKINFTIDILGYNEKNGLEENSSCSKQILVKTEIDNSIIYSWGKVIMPSNPPVGFIFLIIVLVLILYFTMFKADLNKRMENYKMRLKMKKEAKEQNLYM